MNLNPFNKKIGLALGGGAAKGIAHIGVLKSLHRANVKVECVSGSSAGAIVASYFAFGKRVEKFDELVNLLRAKTVMNFSIGRMGLMNTEKLRKYLIESIGDVNIEDANIPLAICATNINTGKAVYFRSGPLVPALCASAAIPGLIQPVEIDGELYVDGGIANNVPLEILEQMGAGITIGVDLNGVSHYPKVESVFDVITNSMDIAIDVRTRDQLREADISIELDLSEFSRLDNSGNYEQVLDIGMQCTDEKIHSLRVNKAFHLFYYLKNLLLEIIPFRFRLRLPFSKS